MTKRSLKFALIVRPTYCVVCSLLLSDQGCLHWTVPYHRQHARQEVAEMPKAHFVFLCTFFLLLILLRLYDCQCKSCIFTASFCIRARQLIRVVLNFWLVAFSPVSFVSVVSL